VKLPIVPCGQSALFVTIIILGRDNYLLKGSVCK